MCSAPKTPDPVQPTPQQVANVAPPAEETATAPVIQNENEKRTTANSQKKGTSSLKINLNVGGVSGGALGGGSSGLSIPK